MDKIALGAKIELSRRFFFDYCNFIIPNFYKRDRGYLGTMCEEFQSFVNDDEHDVLVLNLPPRHGKSLTLGKFVEWVLGNDHTKKIMTGRIMRLYQRSFLKMFVIHFKKKRQMRIKSSILIFLMLKSSMEMLQKTFGVYLTDVTTTWQLLQQVQPQVSVLILSSLTMLLKMLRKLTTPQY